MVSTTLVKQIRTVKLVSDIIDRGDGDFHWLQKVSGLSGPLSSMLADTDFVSKNGLDDVIKTKAKEEIRRRYADDICKDEKDAEELIRSIRGDTCLFEVIVCLAYSLNEMFEDEDAYDGCEHFFGILMHNCGLDIYDEEDWDMDEDRVRKSYESHIQKILDRTYNYYGVGGLFPLAPGDDAVSDQRTISLWKQMNNWVDQHTDEDGEWVD